MLRTIAIATMLATASAAASLDATRTQPGRLADAVAAVAAAAPLFIQAFGAPLLGDANGAWAGRAKALQKLGLDVVGDCTPGYLLPPIRAPAAVALPSIRMTLTAGACVAAQERPNATYPLPVVTCTPFLTSYDYTPASVLPPRTTPGAAVGPACALSAALGGNATGLTQVIIPPVSMTCASLDALKRGDCVIGGGVPGGTKKRGKKQRVAVSGVPDADAVLGDVRNFLERIFAQG